MLVPVPVWFTYADANEGGEQHAEMLINFRYVRLAYVLEGYVVLALSHPAGDRLETHASESNVIYTRLKDLDDLRKILEIHRK